MNIALPVELFRRHWHWLQDQLLHRWPALSPSDMNLIDGRPEVLYRALVRKLQIPHSQAAHELHLILANLPR